MTHRITADDVQRLVDAKAKHNISVEELARRVSLHRNTVALILKGGAKSSARLPDLYRVLGIPEELMGTTGAVPADMTEERLLAAYRAIRVTVPEAAEVLLKQAERVAQETAELRARQAALDEKRAELIRGSSLQADQDLPRKPS